MTALCVSPLLPLFANVPNPRAGMEMPLFSVRIGPVTAGVADSMEPILKEEGRVPEEREYSKEREVIVYIGSVLFCVNVCMLVRYINHLLSTC